MVEEQEQCFHIKVVFICVYYMCIKCHQGISDEEMIKSLEEVNDDEFIRWNTTSISHIKLAALGFNGPEARILAIEVFKRFIEWRKTQPIYYSPPTGVEEMPLVSQLEQDLFYFRISSPNYSDKHSILEKYAEYIKTPKITDNCSIQ